MHLKWGLSRRRGSEQKDREPSQAFANNTGLAVVVVAVVVVVVEKKSNTKMVYRPALRRRARSDAAPARRRATPLSKKTRGGEINT